MRTENDTFLEYQCFLVVNFVPCWVIDDRFNGTHMLDKLRNKRMIIVGDSLNRNMWESLACLLYISIPSSRVQVNAQDLVYKVLKAKVHI